MKKKSALKTRTTFERIYRSIYPHRQKANEESPERKASATLELPPIGDLAPSDRARLCELWEKAQGVLNKSASTDPAFKKYLTDWLKTRYATTCWSPKSGADALTSNRRAIKLLLCGDFSQKNSDERPFGLCVAREGGRWKLFVGEKCNRFWKGKSTDWFRHCRFSEATGLVTLKVTQALTKLQTREGLYRVVIASHFWAHYD